MVVKESMSFGAGQSWVLIMTVHDWMYKPITNASISLPSFLECRQK